MANLAEILMVEHLAIRHSRKALEISPDMVSLETFNTYLKNCHIEIEEKVLFPIILESNDISTSIKEGAKRIMADHKLIQALFGNLSKWYTSQDMEKFGSRYSLYFKLLQDHNDKEDSNIFPHWDSISGQMLTQAKKEAASIIDSFGKRQYLEVTGLTRDSYLYLFR